MNAAEILNDTMTLEEKLKAIDEAIDEAIREKQTVFNEKNGRHIEAPVDPSLLTVCDGCE